MANIQRVVWLLGKRRLPRFRMSVCQFFLSDAGCSFGADCRLAHISPPRQQQQQQDQQQDQQPQRPSSSRHRGTRGPADAAAQRPQSAGRGRGRGRGQAQGRGQQLARGAGGAAAGPAPDSVHSAAQNRQPQQTASGSRPGSSRSRQHKRPQQQAAAVDAPQADQREPEPAPASAPAPSTPPAPVRAPPVSRPAVARPVPKSLAARLQETTDPIDRSRLTRELELSQLERRFRPTKYAIQPSPMVSLSGPAPPTVIDIDLIPSDPDFPYDLEALHVRLSVPALYPTDPVCRLEVLNDEIPGPLRRNVERGWAKKMAASRTGLLAMINWLDTNLERLFVQRDDDEGMIRSFQSGVGSASGSVAPSSTGATAGDEDDNDAGQSGDEDEDKALDRGTPDGDGSGRPFGFGVNVTKEEIARLAGDIEDVLDMDGPQQQQQQQSDSHDTDDHELDAQDGSDGELPSMDGGASALRQRGTSVRFPKARLDNIALLHCTALSLSIRCKRCKDTRDIQRLLPSTDDNDAVSQAVRTSCKTCQSPMTVAFRRDFMHMSSASIGFLDLDGATPFDLMPSTYAATCSSCNHEHTFGNLPTSTPVSAHCRSCHTQLSILLEQPKFVVIGASSSNSSGPVSAADLARLADSMAKRKQARKKTLEDEGISVGSPLPKNGACKHYSKSYRWFRFPCCGKLYPCDVCHEDRKGDKHVMEWANRMVCGFCSREMAYSQKPCACGRELTRKQGAGSAFWEGGAGTRDRTRMSSKDTHKYKGLNKTISAKAMSKK